MFTNNNDKYIRNLFASFNFDYKKVDCLLAEGNQHLIYRYDKRFVLKIPKRTLYSQKYSKCLIYLMTRDIKILKKHLPEYMLETKILIKNNRYVIIQEYVSNFQCVNQKNIPIIRKQIQNFMDKNERLRKENGLSVDLLGNKAFKLNIFYFITINYKKAFMQNIGVQVIRKQYRLKIIDTNLSDVKFQKGCYSIFHWLNDWINYKISKFLIKHLFGISI